MPDMTIDYAAGPLPDAATLQKMKELIHHILQLPEFRELDTPVVLNILISSYWTAAHLAGVADQAAMHMVRVAGQYLAEHGLAEIVGSPSVMH